MYVRLWCFVFGTLTGSLFLKIQSDVLVGVVDVLDEKCLGKLLKILVGDAVTLAECWIAGVGLAGVCCTDGSGSDRSATCNRCAGCGYTWTT